MGKSVPLFYGVTLCLYQESVVVRGGESCSSWQEPGRQSYVSVLASTLYYQMFVIQSVTSNCANTGICFLTKTFFTENGVWDGALSWCKIYLFG
jgi:hypothetical protein